MTRAKRVIESAAYFLDELANGNLYLGPLVVMTKQHREEERRGDIEFGRHVGPAPSVALVRRLKPAEES